MMEGLLDTNSFGLEHKGPWLWVCVTSHEDVGQTPLLPLEKYSIFIDLKVQFFFS